MSYFPKLWTFFLEKVRHGTSTVVIREVSSTVDRNDRRLLITLNVELCVQPAMDDWTGRVMQRVARIHLRQLRRFSCMWKTEMT